MRRLALLFLVSTIDPGPAYARTQDEGQEGDQDRPVVGEIQDKPEVSAGGLSSSGNTSGNTVEPLSRVLDNGLRVIVIPDSSDGLVAVQTWISVGSGGEVVPGTTGYAHFFEHLMFHGTPTWSGGARESRLVELGVEENAWTSQDETCYHLLGPSQHVDELLKIEADRFAHLQLTANGVRREAGAVYGEFRKSEADPYNALWNKLWSTAFRIHPYKHDTLGIEADIQAMPDGLQRALDFRAAHYRPDNALLIVSGDVEPAKVMAGAQEHFGDWQVAGRLADPVPREPAQRTERRAHVDWHGPAIAPKLAVGWRVPGFVAGDAQSAAMEVVRELLTARSAPLIRRVIDEKRLAYEVFSEPPHHVDGGLLSVFFDLQQQQDPDAVLREIDAALAELAEISDGKVLLARSRVQRQMRIALAGPEERAMEIGQQALHAGEASAYSDHVQAVGTVEPAVVRDVVRRFLVPSRRTVVTLGSATPTLSRDPRK